MIDGDTGEVTIDTVFLVDGLLVLLVTLTISMARIVVGGGRVPLVLNLVVVVAVVGVREGFFVILIESVGTNNVVGASSVTKQSGIFFYSFAKVSVDKIDLPSQEGGNASY